VGAELVQTAAGGDREARERLVDACVPMIARVARRYVRGRAVERRELMQEGVVGLLRALERYDASVGAPFWAYASWWVRQAMQRLVSEMASPVVLSDRALRQLARLKTARSRHLQVHGEEPDTADLIQATGLSRERVGRLFAAERRPRGLEEQIPAEDGWGTSLGELVPDPVSEDGYDRALESIQSKEVRDLSTHLPERERNIILAHYGFRGPAQTLRQIAEHMELSVERVRQLEERALGRLREAAA
jgi:RNA polymerase sigma factor (sigma-70 family)